MKKKLSDDGKTRKCPQIPFYRVGMGVFMSILMIESASAQTADGNAGINQANTFVRSYFDSGVNLVYAIGALVGLIGAVKVYQKWNHGDHDTGKVAAAWFGSCIFLVIVATVLKSFFGL
jgi:Domain of unknown function (DUF4134)